MSAQDRSVRSAKFPICSTRDTTAKPLEHTRDGKHKFLVDLDHDLTESVSKASFLGNCYTPKALGNITSEGRDGRCKNFMRRGHQIQRATNSWNTASAVHLPPSIYLPATCALVHTECHGSPSVAEHASISNSETSADRGSAGSPRTPRNKSTVDTAAALL